MLNHLYCEWLTHTFANYVSDCIEAKQLFTYVETILIFYMTLTSDINIINILNNMNNYFAMIYKCNMCYNMQNSTNKIYIYITDMYSTLKCYYY